LITNWSVEKGLIANKPLWPGKHTESESSNFKKSAPKMLLCRLYWWAFTQCTIW